MKTSELTGAALDWAVAIANGENINCGVDGYSPSTDWAQGGPIIEREKIDVYYERDLLWVGSPQRGVEYTGQTPLIAAMRCYVASKLGDQVEIPAELLTA